MVATKIDYDRFLVLLGMPLTVDKHLGVRDESKSLLLLERVKEETSAFIDGLRGVDEQAVFTSHRAIYQGWDHIEAEAVQDVISDVRFPPDDFMVQNITRLHPEGLAVIFKFATVFTVIDVFL